MRFIMTQRADTQQGSAMGYVIKRYSNRKLYDTQESRYVTLEEIEEMIRPARRSPSSTPRRARTSPP